jgi:hypothetical protein
LLIFEAQRWQRVRERRHRLRAPLAVAAAGWLAHHVHAFRVFHLRIAARVCCVGSALHARLPMRIREHPEEPAAGDGVEQAEDLRSPSEV